MGRLIKTERIRDMEEPRIATKEEREPDWDSPCDSCGQLPTLPLSGMCGPCTFGEAETVGGNW